MLELPTVTLIAFGTTNLSGMARALNFSQRGIRFGAVKMITEISCPNIDEWNRNIVFRLGEFVETDFALLIHPDGFVVHPESWRDEFLNYDYIGAPWPMPTDDFSYRDKYGIIQRVGNSISLRSKKLLDLPSQIGMKWQSYHGFYNEDGYICVNNRHIFEDFGCKFAPVEVAAKFGREVPIPENEILNPFVFHKHQGQNEIYPNFEI